MREAYAPRISFVYNKKNRMPYSEMGHAILM